MINHQRLTVCVHHLAVTKPALECGAACWWRLGWCALLLEQACKHWLLAASSSLIRITLTAGQHEVTNLLVSFCLALSLFAQALILFLKTVDLILLVTQLLLGLSLEKLLLFTHAALDLGTLHIKDLRLTKLVDHHVDDAVLLYGRQVGKAIHVAAVLLALFLALALNAVQSSGDLIRRHALGFQANGSSPVLQLALALSLVLGSGTVSRHVNGYLLVATKLRLDHFYQGFGVLVLQIASLKGSFG